MLGVSGPECKSALRVLGTWVHGIREGAKGARGSPLHDAGCIGDPCTVVLRDWLCVLSFFHQAQMDNQMNAVEPSDEDRSDRHKSSRGKHIQVLADDLGTSSDDGCIVHGVQVGATLGAWGSWVSGCMST